MLIADDEPEIRSALAELIASEPSLKLVGSAADAEEAVKLAREQLPDVAVLDVKMPAGGGTRATREIRRCSPETRVLGLSAYEDRKTVLEMLGAGAVGYLVKGTSPEEIVSSIHRTMRGQSSLSAEVMASVVQDISVQLELAERESEDRRLTLIRIKRAVAGEGFGIVFQPIIDLVEGDIVGQEALARFTMPPEQTPDLWFSEAASLGLGVDLEITAVRAALREAAGLPPDVYLSLNLSHRTAMSARFLEALADAACDRIVIELTEHERVEDYEALGDAIDRFRRQGGRLAIDDAGAGFASLRHTLRLAPDIIKLDISLTRDIDSDRARRALAAGLISFAEEMDMSIVAEGIETQSELDALLTLGVRYGQGFFLARPAPLA